jgi:Tfp pilus assembly protein PilF
MSYDRIDQLLKFLQLNSRDSFVKYALALEYINEGDDAKGKFYFNEILQNDPDYVGTYYHLGKLYERLNEKSLAKETYREGLKRSEGKDGRTYQELQEALNQLLYEDE